MTEMVYRLMHHSLRPEIQDIPQLIAQEIHRQHHRHQPQARQEPTGDAHC